MKTENNMNAFEEIKQLIFEKKSFVLEAGAGSGKTYTLIQTLNFLLQNESDNLKYKNQKIVCITYTNVAKNQIIERIQNNPLVIVLTIHEFLWDCIKSFNKQLIKEFDNVNTDLHNQKPDKIELLNLIDKIDKVEYEDWVFSDFEQGKVGHDDLILLSKKMFEANELLTTIIAEKYPYIFIDEYQDTAEDTVIAFIDYLLERNKDKLIIGFYGDSYQKIYDTGVGSLQHYIDIKKITLVTKPENYRSSTEIIRLLNNIRDNIKQEIPEGVDIVSGDVEFINCNNYPEKVAKQGVRDYENSLIPIKNSNYESVKKELESNGWDFGKNSKDKILIIANSRVSQRGGFGNLYKTYSKRYGQLANDRLLKRDHPLTTLFVGTIDKKTSTEREIGIEHLVKFYQDKDYANLISFLNKNSGISTKLNKHSNKKEITDKIGELIKIRESKTIKDVIDFVETNALVVFNNGTQKLIEKSKMNLDDIVDEDEKKKIKKDVDFFNSLMLLQYDEVIKLFKHSQNENVFSTKHGTKGEEYRNVLVIIDDTSWKQKYNFQNFFDNSEDNQDRKLRTKNLFYVSCSRAKEKLIVLALSKMEISAMKVIRNWFGDNKVSTIGSPKIN
ncbi:UvrD-helicase domain-containing protein [Winogradskyella sp. Asnod2-B02-A]|uniref:UvrD-helicase domain-containing protein n=1 Tax=Winogradskyella sp. Asnod2-B02-A TaxID=3160583 RepID=UPI0038709ABA